MTNVIPLTNQIQALHPRTKKPVTVVGIEVTHSGPQLIVLHNTYEGIWAEVVDECSAPMPTMAAA